MDTKAQESLLGTVHDFVEEEVRPVVRELDAEDAYPHGLVERMKELGLFGAILPEEYGGLGLSASSYTKIIEELSRGWMSIAGIINSHLILAYNIYLSGTPEQRDRFLPDLCSGQRRGGLSITEPSAGSDVQAIRTEARREGDHYVVNGHKKWISNGIFGNTFLVAMKTDPTAEPAHRGISAFIVEKGGPGFEAKRRPEKLGYRGIDSAEFVFEDFRVPAENLLGNEEGKGFQHIMKGLELGRINVAARGLGIARAAFEDAIAYAQKREAFGKPISEHQAVQLKLADMAVRIEASRLLVRNAAEKFDRGERCDLEAGMAKLFASEAGIDNSLDAMRIHGGNGYHKDYDVERYFRDAPLMAIGEGTNEIQRMVIARGLLKQNALDLEKGGEG
ncbi:acyl-CoA dehydrogenase [Rubrobacter marinus]|uniref:Acyl-CoA dehydrogenase n=1 Tax=Rubrobacter marinus TaxID=2653852 RepID=A0A6G8PW86_9ACTN|nr:acyl-CoA dehydrogenase family protein [Rubrobacter marinus]QIN78481.1 acyl-CoA dehydrogenase [Rubrobacter marinus]